jgi:hypothetical protein
MDCSILVFGAVGFYGLIAACFVFARRFRRQHSAKLFWYSVLTGIGFLVSFATIASGSTSAAIMIGFCIAVAWIWLWHTVVLLQLGNRAESLQVPRA